MKNIFTFLLLMFWGSKIVIGQTNLNTEAFIAQYKAKPKSLLIDVRTPTEWAKGNIKAAKGIDYKDPSFKNSIASLDKSTPVFLFCAAGVRSAGASKIMKEMGFKEIYNLTGAGYSDLAQKGLK